MCFSHSTPSQVLKTFPSFSPLLCKVVKTQLSSLLKALKIPNKMLDGDEYSPPAAPTDSFSALNTRKKKNKNKRRFSDEQIRSLETIFESESKLEPRKKLQVARELGLQPRQVAIWFQNKRARWKSKQLEQDYTVLHTNYTTLVSRFEALKKENQTLILKLQKLNDQMQKPREERQCCTDGESEDGETTNTKCESEVKASLLSLERIEQGVGVLSDDDSSIKAGEYFGLQEEETELLNMVEPADGSLTSTENWGSFDTDGLFDESSSSYQWWDFWS